MTLVSDDETSSSTDIEPQIHLGEFDWNDGTDAASAFWAAKRHATCMSCGGRMYKVRLTNERGTYDEFRHDDTGSVWCIEPTIEISRRDLR